MDHQTVKPSRSILTAAVCVLLAAPLAAAFGGTLGSSEEATFKSSRPLPQDKDEVLSMVQESMHEIGVKSVDRENGVVVSNYYHHTVGPNRFRTLVTAVVTRRAEGGTVLQVKAQRELLMDALTPGVFQGVQRWQKVGSHGPVEEEIISRVEKAAGVWVDPEKEAMREAADEALQAAGGLPPGAAVDSGAWKEIEDLKQERRQILAPIEALDRRALDILYSGDPSGNQGELDKIREERNQLWEDARPRVMELDKRILELVLSE